MSRRCMTPSVVSCSAPSSAFWRRSSSVRSATRCSRPSNVSRSCEVMSLNAIASVPTSSFVVTGASRVRSPAVTSVAVRVIARIGFAIRRERMYVPAPSSATHGEAEAADREAQPAGGRERHVLVHLGDERGAGPVEPRVRADHGCAAVVVVERVPRLFREAGVDAAGANAPRGCRLQALAYELAVGRDEVHLAGVAEACCLQHDAVEPLQVEVGGELADLLAVAREERRRDRDRRLPGQARGSGPARRPSPPSSPVGSRAPSPATRPRARPSWRAVPCRSGRGRGTPRRRPSG